MYLDLIAFRTQSQFHRVSQEHWSRRPKACYAKRCGIEAKDKSENFFAGNPFQIAQTLLRSWWTHPRQLVVEYGLGEGLQTANEPVHGDLVAFDFVALELRRLWRILKLYTNLIGTDRVLDMTMIFAQIIGIHILHKQRGAIVLLVQWILNRIFLRQRQCLAIFVKEAHSNGIGTIITIDLGSVALLRVHMMTMRRYFGTVLHIDGEYTVWWIRTAILSEALIDASVILIHILQHYNTIGRILRRCLQSLTLRGRIKKKRLER